MKDNVAATTNAKNQTTNVSNDRTIMTVISQINKRMELNNQSTIG